MGRDGARGMLRLRSRGWHTIAQDEATSVVWSMPKAAIDMGAASVVLPVGRMPQSIQEHLR
jgi:chemotaxis response regulator CheB